MDEIINDWHLDLRSDGHSNFAGILAFGLRHQRVVLPKSIFSQIKRVLVHSEAYSISNNRIFLYLVVANKWVK